MSELDAERQHFAVKRGLLGFYVFLHFAALLPYAAELFSAHGMLGRASDSPLMRAFPNVLAIWDGPRFVQAFVGMGAASALLLGLGIVPRLTGVIAYYVWACLFTRNPLIANPSLAYVGLMLLVCAVVGRTDRRTLRVEFTRVTTLLWIAMALGYSYSGLTKLSSASWLDGSAVHAVLQSPLARPHALRDLLLLAEPGWLRGMSYAALLLELCFAPLALWPKARPILWGSMLAMHLTLCLLVQFADLSVGMLVLHAFSCDPAWFTRKTERSTVKGPQSTLTIATSSMPRCAETRTRR